MVKRTRPKITSEVCAVDVIVFKMNNTRSGPWKAFNNQPESRLFTTGHGMPLKVVECKIIKNKN